MTHNEVAKLAASGFRTSSEVRFQDFTSETLQFITVSIASSLGVIVMVPLVMIVKVDGHHEPWCFYFSPTMAARVCEGPSVCVCVWHAENVLPVVFGLSLWSKSSFLWEVQLPETLSCLWIRAMALIPSNESLVQRLSLRNWMKFVCLVLEHHAPHMTLSLLRSGLTCFRHKLLAVFMLPGTLTSWSSGRSPSHLGLEKNQCENLLLFTYPP